MSKLWNETVVKFSSLKITLNYTKLPKWDQRSKQNKTDSFSFEVFPNWFYFGRIHWAGNAMEFSEIDFSKSQADHESVFNIYNIWVSKNFSDENRSNINSETLIATERILRKKFFHYSYGMILERCNNRKVASARRLQNDCIRITSSENLNL